MSIEQVLTDLVNAIAAQTKAIEANTAAIANMGAGVVVANSAVSTATSDTATPTTPKKKRQTAAEKAAAEKAAAEAAASELEEASAAAEEEDDDDLFGDSAPEVKSYTLDEVKEVMTASVPVLGKPTLIAILKQYGVSKLTEIPESKYATFVAEIQDMMAAKKAA